MGMEIERIREAIRTHHDRVADQADEGAIADHLLLERVLSSAKEERGIEE